MALRGPIVPGHPLWRDGWIINIGGLQGQRKPGVAGPKALITQPPVTSGNNFQPIAKSDGDAKPLAVFPYVTTPTLLRAVVAGSNPARLR